MNKANLRDLIAATGLVILLKLDSNHRFFSHVTLKFDWSGLDIKHLVYVPVGHMVLTIYVPCKFFTCPANICTSPLKLMYTAGKILLMASKNYRAPLVHYIKLCASSQTPRWIRTAVALRKSSIRVKIGNFLPRVTLKFNGWPWKTIGILFYVTLSFMHHFKAIGEFKLKLQSGNAQFGPKWAIFCPVWPSNLMDDLEKQ